MSLRHRLLAVAGLSAGLLAGVAYAAGALSGLERQAVDARFGIRGAQAPSGRVVIVAVDDRTLRTIGTVPPIPRGYYARLLDRLHAAKPSLIGVDVQFIGKGPRPGDDRALRAAIAADGPVVVTTPDPGQGSPSLPTGAARVPGAVPAAAGVDTDADGILRRMLYRQVALETFAVRAAEMLRGTHVDAGAFDGNHAWIDFRGPPGTFPTVSMADVLAGTVPAGRFAGKAVLVGVTAPVQKDVFGTAASSTPMAGVEVHANALETILDGFPLAGAPVAVDLALILLLAAIPPLLALRLPSLYALAASIAALVVFLVVAQLAFGAGWILPVSYPILALALSAVGVVAADAFVERRQRRALEQALDGVLRPGRAAYFISYRRGQAQFVAFTLAERLTKRFGKRSVFLDRSGIDAGAEFPVAIREAILGCSVMLVLMGPAWLGQRDAAGRRRIDLASDWVRKEVEAGLARPEVTVVPILFDGAQMPDEGELPEAVRPLARRNAFELTGEDLDAELERLAESIQSGQIRNLARTAAPAPERELVS